MILSTCELGASRALSPGTVLRGPAAFGPRIVTFGHAGRVISLVLLPPASMIMCLSWYMFGPCLVEHTTQVSATASVPIRNSKSTSEG